jgi:hypothetical protein
MLEMKIKQKFKLTNLPLKEVLMQKANIFLKTIFLLLSLFWIAPIFAQNPDSIPFTSAVNYGAGDGPYYIFCSDLDGDLDMDIAVANGNSNNVSVLKNNGNGTFQTKVDYNVETSPVSVFSADLDGDGDMDLAVANDNSNNVSILKNNGDGTFQAKINYGTGSYPFGVFGGDLDGDSDIDLVAANLGSDNVSVLINNGNGTFQTKVDYAAGDGARSVFCADLDGDSDIDLAVANEYANTLSILKNNGNGTFQTKVDYVTGDGPFSVFCADLDGDLDLDLAIANYYGNAVSIFKNNGNGTFQSKVDYATGSSPWSVYCADLDADGDLDLALAIYNGVSILKNNGDATFQAKVYYAAGNTPHSICCADFDLDFDLDLAVANWYSDNVSILSNLTNPPPPKILLLKDGSTSPAPIASKAFKIYQVTNNPPTMSETYKGQLTADANGKIAIPWNWFNPGDWVKVERLIYTKNAAKHKSILPNRYYIKIDNGKFDTSTGAISYHTFTADSLQETMVDHTTVMFDLLVSVEWDADLQFLESLRDGFKYMSNYLYDVADGQLYLDSIKIFDNKVNWDSADVQIHASNLEWPHASTFSGNIKLGGGIRDSGDSRLYFPRIFYFNSYDGNRNLTYVDDLYPYDWAIAQTSYDGTYKAYPPSRTLAHEFGHYGIGFRDEYIDEAGNSVLDDYDFGLMDDQLGVGISQNSEMSCSLQYNDLSHQVTRQWTNRGNRSCWEYFEWNYQGTYDGIFAPIKKPSTQMFWGPNDDLTNLNYDVALLLKPVITDYPGGAFTDIVTVKDGFGFTIGDTKVTLYKNNSSWVIEQGNTADNGKIRGLGVNNGDIIRSYARLYSFFGVEWSYSEITVGEMGLSRFKNPYRTSASGDSTEIILRKVQGNYKMNNRAVFEAENSFRYHLQTSKSFSQNPGLEFHPGDGQLHNYNFAPVSGGYETIINDPLGPKGLFSVIAVDDSGYSFFVNNNYTTTHLSESLFSPQIYGPEGACELILDTLNTSSFQKIVILSSDFPPLLNGLDSLVKQAGAVHSISAYPNISSLSGLNNYLLIRYSDSDLKTASESSLKIFKWNESSNQWEFVGGNVDTTKNEVMECINGLGTYTLFATALMRGDANIDGIIDIGDIVYLINYVFYSGTPPAPEILGDVNCDAVVDIGDIVFLINYVFYSGPEPVCK